MGGGRSASPPRCIADDHDGGLCFQPVVVVVAGGVVAGGVVAVAVVVAVSVAAAGGVGAVRGGKLKK